MKTNARAVFAVLNAARELKLKEKAEFMHSLIDVAVTPSQSIEYVKGLQSHYRSLADNVIPEHKKAKSTSTNVMPWEAATALMKSAERTKIRLERGAR